MASPALLLADLLQSVPKNEKQKKLVLAFSDHLGLNSGVVEDQVVIHVRGLVNRCHSIIDRLSFPDSQKSLARSLLSGLEGFRQYSAFSYTIEQADNPILQPVTITGLRTLDMIISPHSAVQTFESSEQIEALQHLRKALEGISKLEFPEQIRILLQKRLLQVIEAIEHHDFFGEDEIQTRLDALLGQVAVAASGKSSGIKVWAKKVVGACAVIGAAIVGINEVAGAYLDLKQKYPEIAGDFSDVSE